VRTLTNTLHESLELADLLRHAGVAVGRPDDARYRSRGRRRRRRRCPVARERNKRSLAVRTGLELRELTAEAGVDLLVNDRVDIARAIDADGVHVGQSDLSVGVARDLLGSDAIVGCSASTVAEAREADADGADYLGVGAVYGTSSKDIDADKDGVGPERIAEIADAVSIPIVGIGGITADNARPVVEAGAAGVAVISAITARLRIRRPRPSR